MYYTKHTILRVPGGGVRFSSDFIKQLQDRVDALKSCGYEEEAIALLGEFNDSPRPGFMGQRGW